MLPKKPNVVEHSGNVIMLQDSDFIETIGWFQKNKSSVYTTIALIVGLFGGNVDRTYNYLNNISKNTNVIQRIELLEQRMDSYKCTCNETLKEVLVPKEDQNVAPKF